MKLRYEAGQLTWENLPLATLSAVGTPLYVYSEATLRRQAQAYLSAAACLNGPAHLCYAVKANGHPEIIKLFAEMGLGADVTSGGELFLSQHAGVNAHKIIYSGVGKTAGEIRTAIQQKIRAIHIESEAEFDVVAAMAQAEQCVATIAVRVNPNVAASTHPYISTGGKYHKFGVNADIAAHLLRQAAANEWLDSAGIAIHIGSQITNLDPFGEAVQLIIQLADSLREAGVPIRYLDVGGGLGIDYAEQAPSPAAWVKAIAAPVVAAGYEVAMEPGRSLVGQAGLLLTAVQFLKSQGDKQFVIVDAGMNDLIRPTLYQAHHPILPIRQPQMETTTLVDIVGPVCESGDFVAKDRALPAVHAGELLAITHAGAYSFAMSSNYNGRLRPAEVMIAGDSYRIIRKRQSLTDLLPQL